MRDRSIEGDEIGAQAGFDGTQHVRLAGAASATGKEWIVTVTFGSSTDAEVDRPDRPASDSPLDHCKAHIHQNAHGGDDE
jgi:hypothetical protein